MELPVEINHMTHHVAFKHLSKYTKFVFSQYLTFHLLIN